MTVRLLALLTRGVLVAVLLALTAQAHAGAATTGPVRILLSGDSITQGFDGDYTWRYRLWQEFQAQGVPVDFVGSRSLPYVAAGFSTSHYLDPHFDTDHFAFGGARLAWLATQIQAEVATQQPDVVVVAAGVNDLRYGDTPAQTADALRAYVAGVRAAKPDTQIIVSPVLGAFIRGVPGLPAAITAYDAMLPALVQELSTPLSPVTLADTTAGWSPVTDSYYYLHPNPTGETLIAQHIAEALQQIGVLPQVGQIYRPVVWHRDLTAVVRVRHHRVKISWDRESLTGVRIWLSRVGGPRARFQPGRFRAGHRTLRLPAGRYEVRLVAIRHAMVSPLGPATRFRVS
ncbi:GDSL-type esterase/lipase family protein [Nocardioides mangrovicus]|uniref:GDSL-type esterase/lipase family protein n=1 Tax=Nocardioides mangrovicus TaxID=2478913 RepID=UPI0013142C1F|nr:GDSL-type esterase/lipase family protein [Nocardioides mangrovicus]